MNKPSQVLKRAITDATLMKWCERHCREQWSDRNTGRGEKKGFETDCCEQKSHTEPGDAFRHTTRAREDEQHSKDIVGS